MANRRNFPIYQRDAASVQLAKDCEGHMRILHEQRIKAREMIHLAHDTVALAASMRKFRRLVLP